MILTEKIMILECISCNIASILPRLLLIIICDEFFNIRKASFFLFTREKKRIEAKINWLSKKQNIIMVCIEQSIDM